MASGTTDAGLAAVAALIEGSFTYLALGTGTTEYATTQTALVSELTDTGLERASGTISLTTTTVTDDTVQATHTWTATGSQTIAEAGWFDAASGGNMLARDKFESATDVENGSAFVWTVTCAFS